MTVQSNLYASRIFSEHPITCFPLDDVNNPVVKVTRIMNDNDFSSWTVGPGIVEGYNDPPDPAKCVNFTKTLVQQPLNIVSPVFIHNISAVSQLNVSFRIATDAVGAKISVGIETDAGPKVTPTSSTLPHKLDLDGEVAGELSIPQNTWVDVKGHAYGFASSEKEYKIWIRLSGTPHGVDLNYWVSDITVMNGTKDITTIITKEWNEAHYNFDPIFGGLTCKLLEAVPYAGADERGYYLIEDDELLAKNYGIPLVYGSDNSTKIYPSTQTYNISKAEYRSWSLVKNDGGPDNIWGDWKSPHTVHDLLYEYEQKVYFPLPSIVLPGHGVINQGGRYNTYTVEFWMKLTNNSLTSKKIWGPLRSSDGLYVKDGFITLMIGNKFASHPIGSWGRPMLIDMIFRRDQAVLVINGERVATVRFDSSKIDLAPVDEDWVGFFGDKDIQNFEIDCYSLFPYAVPDLVAKRRFVWGQGVESVAVDTNAYDSSLAFIDYPVAEYTTQKLYPDVERWDAGYSNNLVATRNSLSTPNYKLPSINIGGYTEDVFYWENLVKNGTDNRPDTYFTLHPDPAWTQPCHLLYNSLNVLNDPVKMIYGTFEGLRTPDKQTLFKFVNTASKHEIEFFLLEDKVKAEYRGDTTFTLREHTVDLSKPFGVGIHLGELFALYGSLATRFFGTPSLVQLYVGGDGVNTFEGKIYRVGFCNEASEASLPDFGEVVIESDVEAKWFMTATASYTLKAKQEFNTYFLDIAVSAYWEEYFPLSYFAKMGWTPEGQQVYDLDFIQYNRGFPTVATQDVDGNYDFSKSPIKTYLTFQRLTNKRIIRHLDEFPNHISLGKHRIVDTNEDRVLVVNGMTTRAMTNISQEAFEITDRTIIYPPKRLGIHNTAVVLHHKIEIDGILSSPFKMRSQALASKVLDDFDFPRIGTRYGYEISPYLRAGHYYDYRGKVPFCIYKGNTPYLYLTQDSGIEVVGTHDTIEKGITLPINKQLVQSYDVIMFEVWVNWGGTDQQTLFSLDAPSGIIDFGVTKGTLTFPSMGMTFFQDGNKVGAPVLVKGEWTIIGVVFRHPINFGNYLGGINLLSGAVFNGISFHHPTGAQLFIQKDKRTWEEVKDDNDAATVDNWAKWQPITLSDMLYKTTHTEYPIGPDMFYDVYTGTNRTIVDDTHGMLLQEDAVVLFSDIEWSSFSRKPL
jgi:hypothetical protein